MSLQKYFTDFYGEIKLDYTTSKGSELREKRDILINILKNSDKLPGFDKYDQGSYGMHLGTEPVNGKEYDIDVALRFNVNKDDYEPMELKEIICEILKDHTDYGAKIKKPCVTVTYKKKGEAAFHVDLVTYTYEDNEDHSSQLYLARGKKSEDEETKWEKSDPVGLVDYVNKAVDEDNREQFRRTIRYLKRWKNLKFDSNGHAEPSSIGLTLIVADHFKAYNNGDGLDDLNATLYLAEVIASLFEFQTNEDGRDLYRIKYPMPSSLSFESDTDAFSKMTDIQMTDFKEKVEKLVRDLESVLNDRDEIEQCKKLRRIFGDDFPVPDAENVSKKQYNFIPSSSASGACV